MKMEIIRKKYLNIAIIILLFSSELKSQSNTTWIDTLIYTYHAHIEFTPEGASRPTIKINLNTLEIEQIEDIAQFINSRAKKYFFNHIINYNTEYLYDERRDGAISVNKIPDQISKQGSGILISLTHTGFIVNYIYKFTNLRNIEYIGVSEGNTTISGVTSTTYQKQSFNVTCAPIDYFKLNKLLSYIDIHYNTEIQTAEVIPAAGNKSKYLINSINSDSTITYKYSFITKDLKKEDLRSVDYDALISEAAPFIVLGTAAYGLKKLFDYATSGPTNYSAVKQSPLPTYSGNCIVYDLKYISPSGDATDMGYFKFYLHSCDNLSDVGEYLVYLNALVIDNAIGIKIKNITTNHSAYSTYYSNKSKSLLNSCEMYVGSLEVGVRMAIDCMLNDFR
ncbi:MAG: hypothetical protein IPO45_07045 [Saprospiraceae bacterium]|jgi:hypothetical protein|uniref:hypothetical protein n=2 Tax=Candidatus Brachybacter algidus TaxID=2982024 RepID=UPI001B3E2C61|nr:hypothetical protein [Candidatus Brachybacter algidus]MBP7306474.1 hypothetical protein [Saprospiraceae bacterium]MBP9705380.1 hypothetical protein [Chitinophagales bacterium]MBK6375006.1 hypothetical protein [Candidatus Brachybacter algidus]MBK6450418.1 hypothetical protein [Candidatus Brachybacter algidus]MBK7605195.1 hypothetical protein [Candidatus Brachybacter algidus]